MNIKLNFPKKKFLSLLQRKLKNVSSFCGKVFLFITTNFGNPLIPQFETIIQPNENNLLYLIECYKNFSGEKYRSKGELNFRYGSLRILYAQRNSLKENL